MSGKWHLAVCCQLRSPAVFEQRSSVNTGVSRKWILFVELLAARTANELAWHSGFIGLSLGGLWAEIVPGFSTRE